MIDQKELEEIFYIVKNDPDVLKSLNTDWINTVLLKTIDDKDKINMEKKTFKCINNEIENKFKEIGMSNEKNKELCNTLKLYRLVEDLCDLRIGNYVFWIRENMINVNNNKLSGGIVINKLFNNSGTNILVKTQSNHFLQFNFNKTIIFQKLTETEIFILHCNDFL